MNYFIIPGVNKYQLNVDSIFKAIEKITGINKEELTSKARHRPIVEGRYLFAYIIKKKTNLTLNQIGKLLNKDHCSIIFYNKQMDNYIKSDKHLLNMYNKIINLLW